MTNDLCESSNMERTSILMNGARNIENSLISMMSLGKYLQETACGNSTARLLWELPDWRFREEEGHTGACPIGLTRDPRFGEVRREAEQTE
jgi:hypothetical protein